MATDKNKVDLYLAHRANLVDYAAALVKCRARAEDLVQDAYLRFSPDGPALLRPVHYLYRIVRNLAVETLRHPGHRHTAPLEDCSDSLTATDATPEQTAIDRQQVARLQTILGTLPPAVRRAFEAHRLHGDSLQTIATREGVSVATAHRMVRTALTTLMRELDPPESPAPRQETQR